MRKILILIFCVLGLIVGVIVGNQMTGSLSWLALGGTIGFAEPLVLDLKVFELTIGFWCTINVGGVIGLVIFALLSKWITSWLKI